MTRRTSRWLAAFAALVALLASGRAWAEDECTTDEECVELYADGFICTAGSLGRYCVERGCMSDADCREEYGDDAWCSTWGPEARCEVPSPPKYVPPFRSMCGAAPGAPAVSWLVVAVVLVLVWRPRR